MKPRIATSRVVIDERAMNNIKQIALQLFHDYRKLDRDEVMFEALQKYIEAGGGSPGFEVRKKDASR
jgi:hypothetical protein